ncbi:unnamed protein product [Mytilus edulis]|uniref:Uncharacterized protein n=1 Tax=Mytilus edulis TaxID=6550 RepID=A0A8S3RMA5_MYTED|nr:unnamed protein product [Mytilus edulis]
MQKKDDLIDIDFGDTSLAEWLSIYSDKVNFISDNNRIVHFGEISHAINKKYLKPGFCRKQLVFHKSTYEMMELLQSYNDFASMEKSKVKQSIRSDVSERTIISGVSGSIFSGDVVRKVPQISIEMKTTLFSNASDSKNCDNWAVVTTIHQPSNSVRNIATHPSWCVVIVADVTTPSEDAYLKSVVNYENKSKTESTVVDKKYVTITVLDKKCATITMLDKKCATITMLDKKCATITMLDKKCATITMLDKKYATITVLDKKYVTITMLDKKCATITMLDKKYVTITVLDKKCATITMLDKKYATLTVLDKKYATITVLD